MTLCPFCLAVACDSLLTCFRRNTIKTSSRVFVFRALMFLTVHCASFLNGASEWLFFIDFVVSGCILCSEWSTFTKSSSFLFLSSKVNVFVETGFGIVSTFGRC